ncbi:flagellar basal body P-ring formation chaperone FlgA [Erwinia tasmaniensis]|uniref:Flagella basal body P-ring formation protein FlgA n=1 Tax=Erwinia tasmaniensis (strain DSM 17950 / CFBP 7177 / CIP 109463 / NCPPB 4357 / Et1/99) TaxID=465817 RepID=B2VIB8_ERWT9|nr:flagellar basal body P-ring formation chaperone FlgA [Erwinia tasmaniensis]CAO97088.1 Flagellar biosynthesis; assembly of basal-body periplasmic P ring [Erwinia tasmaniensis Et1/99]
MPKSTHLLAALLSLLCAPASAADLTAQLTEFFKIRYEQTGASADKLKVVVKTAQNMWPACDTPQFSLPGNSRMWGNISVAANCDRNRRYIQVQVQVTGSYVVATRQISQGEAISASDVRMEQGRLDTLPARTLMQPGEAIGAVTLRDITPGQPMTLMMMRQAWRVKAGQTVIVYASGDGFSISSEGKAMNNAAALQSVRVRMNSGQIVMGQVGSDGNVLISL